MELSWEFPGRWGQLPFALPDVAGEDIDVLCTVAPGEGPVIVAAYERAAHVAEQLWDAFGPGWTRTGGDRRGAHLD